MQIPAVDWTGQDVNFAGTPKWYAQVKEALIRRLEALSHQIQHPYGLSPEALEGVRRQKAALEAQAQKLDKPYAIPLSITGTSEKVLFTPAELKRAQNDEVLARKIFESATGIPNPPRADVDEFRQRIIYQYPQLNELVDQQHQFDTQQRQERQNFAQQEMADREFIGDEANWELRNLRRDFQYKQPTGFSVYENRDKYGLNEQRAKAIDSLLEQNAKLQPDVVEKIGQIIPDEGIRQQLFQDINKNYPLNEYDALENLRDARPPVRSQMQYADQTNNQNDPLQQLATLQAQSLQPGGAAYAGQPQQQPQVQQQATGSAPALSVDQIIQATGVKRSIAENIYNQVANKPGAVLGASDNLINTGSLAPAQVKNLENLFRQPNSAPLQSGAAYAGQPQQQQQVLPDMNPYANADNGYMLPKENLSPEEALLNRASIPLKKARLGEQHGRVAPMHPLAEQAQRMMQRNIDSDQPAFEHAQSQLEEAQRLNLPNEIRGHLQSGLTPTYEMLDPYMQSYKQNVIDPLRKEAEINFLEEIMPHVKGQFAASGAYHSGARQNELRKFAEKTQNQLMRDIGRLYHQGQESAFAKANEQNERQMQAAQIAGNAAKAQQEAHVRNAEARRNLGLIQKESKKHDIAAVSQFATQHQQQLQNEMNAKQQAYLESQMEPHVRLGRYADAVAGIPSTSSMQVNAHRGPAPNPPSPYNVVPGLLGQVFGLQNQPAPFKKGGSVNNKYATPEGLVNTAVNEYKQFADSVQPQKYDQEIEDLTTGFRNYKIDPIQNWVQHVSAQMLANNREDPLSNLGRGAIVAEENMMKHRDSMLAAREKAANLYGAMNESRRNQQQLIGDYTQKYAANSETRRHNSAMEALKKQENEIKRLKNSLGASPKEKLDMEYKLAQIDALRGKNIPQTIEIGDVIINPKRKIELSSPDLTQLKQIEKNRELNASKLHGYDEMVKFLQKQEGKDNLPSTGIIAKYTPNVSDLSKEYERHLEKMVSGELPSGVLTNAKLAFAKGLKPTELDSPEKVKKFAEIGKEHYEELVRRDQIAEDLSAYNIPPRVSFAAYDQWKKNKFKGEVVDYVKAILEGGKLPLTQDDSNDYSDISSLSDAELERIAAQ